jgi:hypothetical protein
MTPEELQTLEDTLLKEYQQHRNLGGFDIHAADTVRLFELLYLIAKHLNKKPAKKTKRK